MKILAFILGGLALTIPAAILPPHATEHQHHALYAVLLAIYVPVVLLAAWSERRKARRQARRAAAPARTY